jgi:hypothetical protein
MAGRQFSFFLSGLDQVRFEKALRASGDIAFIENWPKRPRATELTASVISRMGEETLDILIARREDMQRVEYRPIKGREEYSCDPTFAPVVEFSRCYATARFIRAGRLYRVDKYWDKNKQLVSKSNAFIDWADRLYKLAKASLTKVERGYYAGSEALERRNAGVAFEGLDIKIGSIKG